MKIKLFFIFLFSYCVAIAQDIAHFPVSGNSNQVRTINLKENGILLLNKASDGNLHIQKIDTNLTQVWATSTPIPNKTNFIDEYYDGRFVYIVLEPKTGQSFTILKISSSFPGYQKFDFPLSNHFQYAHFAANDQVIALGGSVKSEPFVAIMSTSQLKPKFISGGTKGTAEIQSVTVNDESVTVSILNTHKKVNQILIKEYDYAGQVLSSRQIASKENHNFLSAKYFELENQRILVGNYGIGKIPSSGIQSSQGIFIAHLDRNKTQYISFDKFKNLFGFMSERQKEKLQKQVQKKKDKGSEYSFDYRLYITVLETNNNQTLLVGEVFEPEFRSRNYYSNLYGFYPYSSMYWGRPYYGSMYYLNSLYGMNYRGSQVFDGFKYLEGVVFAINENGDLQWDVSFPYKNLKYYDLKPHLRISHNAAQTHALYSVGSKLNLAQISPMGKVFNQNEYNQESLDLQYANRKTEFTNFEHWYNNTYYFWGVHKINGSQSCFIQRINP